MQRERHDVSWEHKEDVSKQDPILKWQVPHMEEEMNHGGMGTIVFKAIRRPKVSDPLFTF
jgi:hypothetical protein